MEQLTAEQLIEVKSRWIGKTVFYEGSYGYKLISPLTDLRIKDGLLYIDTVKGDELWMNKDQAIIRIDGDELTLSMIYLGKVYIGEKYAGFCAACRG